VHGRIDGPIPEAKLCDFRRAALRAKAPQAARRRDRSASTPQTPRRTAAGDADLVAEVEAQLLGRVLGAAGAPTPPRPKRRRMGPEALAAEATEDLAIVKEAADPTLCSKVAFLLQGVRQAQVINVYEVHYLTRLLADAAAQSPMLGVVETHPRVAGSVVKYLWVERETAIVSPSGIGVRRQRQVSPEIGHLLMASKAARLAVVIGIKDHRALAHAPDACAADSEQYRRICDMVAQVCPEAWEKARRMQRSDTGTTDYMAAVHRLNLLVG